MKEISTSIESKAKPFQQDANCNVHQSLQFVNKDADEIYIAESLSTPMTRKSSSKSGYKVTIAVPSYNQGRYLDQALDSLFNQNLPIEVFVVDGGSTDESLSIIKKWAPHLAGWRSHTDAGQAAAINEGIAQGTAPYVAWLNSDDWLLPNKLAYLVQYLETYPQIPAVYGKASNFIEQKNTMKSIWVEPFNLKRLAIRCIISQPATLIRREAWQAVGGVNPHLHMAMDYELWWKLYKSCGEFGFVNELIAVNREHAATKTATQRRLHYQEAMMVVKQYYGRVPLKWHLYKPYAVWYKSVCASFRHL